MMQSHRYHHRWWQVIKSRFAKTSLSWGENTPSRKTISKNNKVSQWFAFALLKLVAINSFTVKAEPLDYVSSFGQLYTNSLDVNIDGISAFKDSPAGVVRDNANRLYFVGTRARTDTNDVLFVARFNAFGQLDTSFASQGYFELEINEANASGFQQFYTLTFDANNNLYFVGEIGNAQRRRIQLVAKITEAGQIDTGFGNGQGWVVVDNPSEYTFTRAQGITLDSNNNLYTLIRVRNTSTGIDELSLFKFNGTTGALDTNFNNGTGRATLPTGRPSAIAGFFTDSNNNIVIAGTELSAQSQPIGFVARIAPDGTPDTSFNSTGIWKNSTGPRILSAMLFSDDSVLVGGDSPTDNILYRLTASGSLDTNFDTDGIASIQTDLGNDTNNTPTARGAVTGLGLSSQGKVLVAIESTFGDVKQNMVIARIDANSGALDTSFNQIGLARHSALSARGTDNPHLIFEHNNKLIIVNNNAEYSEGESGVVVINADGTAPTAPITSNGMVAWGMDKTQTLLIDGSLDKFLSVDSQNRVVTVGVGTPALDPTKNLLLRRHLANGQLDTTFANGGNLLFSGGHLEFLPIGITHDNQGRILVLLEERVTLNVNHDMVVMRFLTDGTLDTSFGNNGSAKYSSAANANVDDPTDFVVDANNRIIVVGSVSAGQSAASAIVVFTESGVLDTSFGGGDGVFNASPLLRPLEVNVALDANGRVIVSHYISDFGLQQYFAAISRLSPSGVLDLSFGVNGVLNVSNSVVNSSITDLITSGNDIYFAMPTFRQFTVGRVLANGTLDANWGTNGFFNLSIPNPNGTLSPRNIRNILLDSSNRLLMMGEITEDNITGDLTIIRPYLVRLLANGTQDSSFNNNTGLYSAFTPWHTGFEITNSAFDSDGSLYAIGHSTLDSDDFTLLAKLSGNSPPEISGTPATTVAENASYSFTPTVIDNDPTSLRYSIVNKPSWANFNTATGQLSGSPSFTDAGIYTNIIITVSDGEFSASLTSFDITVSNTNQAPQISGTPSTDAAENVLYSFTPNASDGDDDKLRFFISNKPHWATFNTSTGELTGVPGFTSAGVYDKILISVTDGTFVTLLPSFTINVANTNRTPQIDGIPATTVAENTLYSFSPNASDDEKLTFAISNKPHWASFNTSTGLLTGTPSFSDEGNYGNIVISASDGSLSASLPAFNITVTNTNRAPQISGMPGTTIADNEFYNFIPSASDADAEQLIFSITNKPMWAGFDTTTGAISGTPGRENTGSYANIVISVSDGSLSAALPAFTIAVTASDREAPVITLPADITITSDQGEPIAATDSRITAFLSAATARDNIDDNVVIKNNAPAVFALGKTVVTFSAEDSLGNKGEARASVTVIDGSDNVLPVFGELAAIQAEAKGELTSVELPTPQVSDDKEGQLTISVNNPGPYPLGDTVVTWSATDLGGNVATANQTITVVDTTPPEIPELNAIDINARGLLTNITQDINFSAQDLVDGDVAIEIEGDTKLTSGIHTVQLIATDSSGNTAIKEQTVHIVPLVSIVEQRLAEAGSAVELPIVLSGEAVQYPVTVAYSVIVNQQASELTIDIAQGQQALIRHNLADNLTEQDVVEVRLNSAVNAGLSDTVLANITIVDQNFTPTVSAVVSQNTQTVNIVDINGGDIVITPTVSDINVNDSHDISYSSEQLANLVNGSSLTLDVSTLTPGFYTVEITATENNTADNFSSTTSVSFNLVDNLPTLSPSDDTDGDGASDADEGFNDSDGDGIADYLDSNNNTNQLVIDDSDDVLLVSSGLQLSLGVTAHRVIGSRAIGAELNESDLTERFGDIAQDPQYKTVGYLVSFNVSGIQEVGTAISVVLPLPNEVQLPENAVYRKFTPTTGWFDFVEDADNAIKSATRDQNGNCPAVGSGDYSEGLTAGDQCIELTILDGGANDADGQTNGEVEDPGVIAVFNNPPNIVLASEQLQAQVNEIVSLDASATTDVDGDALEYNWVQVEGTAVTLTNSNQAIANFTVPNLTHTEQLTFRVTVTDGNASESAEVEVEIKVEPKKSSGGSVGWGLLLMTILLIGRVKLDNRRQN